MARTTITIPAAEGFDVRMVISVFSKIVASYGYEEKVIKGEPCWSKGDGIIAKQQNFDIVIGQREILIQGWMNDAVTGESDLDGFVAAVPKKKMKGILEELETEIMPIASSRAEGLPAKRALPNKSIKSDVQKKEDVYNSQIEDYQKLISDIFLQLGKQYYELYQDVPDEKLSSLVNQIKEYYAQIEELNKRIEEAKKKDIVCPNCGKQILEGQAFFGNCGSKIQPLVSQEKKNRICQQCGSNIPEGCNFCGMCGTKATE